MKKLIGSLLFAAVTMAAGQAFAVNSGEVMAGCASSINGDSGYTAKLGSADVFGGDSCSCSAVANGQCYYIGTCGGNHQHSGYVVNGESCCVNPYMACAPGDPSPAKQAAAEEVLRSSDAESVEAAFSPKMPYLAYFGYINGNSKSPGWGREQAKMAKLDACLGHANVDADSDFFSCATACNDSLKNQHCQANNSAVCVDRCECRWGQSGCNGL